MAKKTEFNFNWKVVIGVVAVVLVIFAVRAVVVSNSNEDSEAECDFNTVEGADGLCYAMPLDAISCYNTYYEKLGALPTGNMNLNTYDQSFNAYNDYARKFNEVVTTSSSCYYLFVNNRVALTALGYDVDKFIQNINTNYNKIKEFLNKWSSSIEHPCPNGYYLGADEKCYSI